MRNVSELLSSLSTKSKAQVIDARPQTLTDVVDVEAAGATLVDEISAFLGKKQEAGWDSAPVKVVEQAAYRGHLLARDALERRNVNSGSFVGKHHITGSNTERRVYIKPSGTRHRARR